MKKILAIAFVFLFAGFAGAYEMQKFMIAPLGVEPVTGQGTIRVYQLDSQNQMELNIYLENMMRKDGILYEVWLVDDQSGYKLSLGTFMATKFGGKIHFPFKQTMANPKIYDRVVITEEPMNDINPMPSSSVVAEGLLPGIGSTVTMKAHLKGRYELPKSMSSATGNGMFTVDTVANTVSYNLLVTGLEGTETAAHIHGFSSVDANAPAVHPFLLGAVKSGSWGYSEADEWKILAGLTYANVHTTKYPDGEIRGQILPEM